jgi:hypothetical protein
MSDPLDIEQILDRCVLSIRDASNAMAGDMRDAAMKLGAAEMMLGSARHAVHKHAVQPRQRPTESGTEGK